MMQHFIKDNIEELDNSFSKKSNFTVIHNSKSELKVKNSKSKLEASSSPDNSSINTAPMQGSRSEKKVNQKLKNESDSDKFDRECEKLFDILMPKSMREKQFNCYGSENKQAFYKTYSS